MSNPYRACLFVSGVSCGGPALQAIVMEAGAMRSIVALLRSGSPAGRDSAAWALAELAAVDVYGTRAAMRREKARLWLHKGIHCWGCLPPSLPV